MGRGLSNLQRFILRRAAKNPHDVFKDALDYFGRRATASLKADAVSSRSRAIRRLIERGLIERRRVAKLTWVQRHDKATHFDTDADAYRAAIEVGIGFPMILVSRATWRQDKFIVGATTVAGREYALIKWKRNILVPLQVLILG